MAFEINFANPSTRLVAGIFCLGIVLMLLFGCVGSGTASQAPGNGAPSQVAPAPPAPSTASKVDVSTDTKSGYDKTQQTIALAVADGTYSKIVTYQYHSGSDDVNVSISVKDDIVTAASVSPAAQLDNVSMKIIGNYNAALPKLVVGKKITELNLPKNVAGSSLTNAAFKHYVDEVIATY